MVHLFLLHLDAQLTHPHKLLIEKCSLAALFAGVVVRLVQYASNRSLWLDEVLTVLNLQERNYGELLGALSHNQAAPPLFLWIEELAINTLGNNEYALRLYPLIGGLLSLYLCYRFTQRFTDGWSGPVALSLFAIQSYVVYFAGEVKPYSWDVAIGLLLFMMLAAMCTFRPSRKQLIGAGLIGAISIWLSFPSILIMAAVEATNLIKLQVWKAKGREWRSLLVRRLPLYALWLTSLAGLYVANVSKTLSETGLSQGWADRYPAGWLDIWWTIDSLGQFFYKPMGFLSPMDGLAILPFLIGLGYLYRTHGWRLAYLGSPFLLTLLASYLHQYPFRNRLVMFLTPYAFVIFAEGIMVLIRRWRKGPRVLGLLGLLLAAVLLLWSFFNTFAWVIKPERAHFDEFRPAIAHIHNNWQSGDKLYVFPRSRRQFIYYETRFNFPPEDVVFASIENLTLPKLENGRLPE